MSSKKDLKLGDTSPVVNYILRNKNKYCKRVLAVHKQVALFNTELLPKLLYEGDDWVLQELRDNSIHIGDGNKYDYGELYEYLRYIVALMKYYPYDKYDYGDFSYVQVGIVLKDRLSKKVHKTYCQDTKVITQAVNQIEAFRELVTRGFIPKALAVNLDHKKLYLKGNGLDLVYPVNWELGRYNAEAEPAKKALGVAGYTGIYDPRNKL